MSVEAITWALKTTVSHSSAKFVLVVMANCSSAETMEAYPSIAHLSESTEQDRKTVIANIKRLVESGHITDTGKRKGATGQVIVYRLNSTENGIVKESQKRNSTKNGTVPDSPINSPVFPDKESQISHVTVPKTGHGTVSEPSTTKPKSTTTPDGELFVGVSDQVVADFKAMRKNQKAAITKTAIAGIQREADIAGISLEAALTICCERNWRGFKAEWMQSQQARAAPAHQSIHDQRAQAIAELTGKKKNDRPIERDITGESRRIA